MYITYNYLQDLYIGKMLAENGLKAGERDADPDARRPTPWPQRPDADTQSTMHMVRHDVVTAREGLRRWRALSTPCLEWQFSPNHGFRGRTMVLLIVFYKRLDVSALSPFIKGEVFEGWC